MNDFIFTDNSSEVKQALKEKLDTALDTIAREAEGDVKDTLTAHGTVDTGRLRASISNAVSEDTAIIGTNVEYAPYVELGTSKMSARPYMKPGILSNIGKYKKIAEEIMKR